MSQMRQLKDTQAGDNWYTGVVPVVVLVMCINICGCAKDTNLQKDEMYWSSNSVKPSTVSTDESDIDWRRVMITGNSQLSQMVWARGFDRNDMYAICHLIAIGGVELKNNNVYYATLLGQWIGWNPDQFTEKDKSVAAMALKTMINSTPTQSSDWYRIRDVLFMVIPESDWNDYSR